ncbi:PREDICTED: uncharacterized protein LOC106100717 isoform X2 [Papilio polytes]|uniref:uncharacterized protein LOC106100717 isoform X2 n=1 Tax=Papilio polytes TaxID=76194 RepID=UPI000675EB41|nr:PREDICTED: uncharacterized protein LOC106100717 isoform X2 [Papilio polytes]
MQVCDDFLFLIKHFRRQCLCCKNCTECQEFKKVISETGFEVYLYTQDADSYKRNYDLLEHQGFIFQNTQDDTINSNEFLRKIESSDFTCQRCRAILKRLANVFKNTTIKKNEIIVICDCCISDQISEVEPCKYCHNIYDKFNLNKSLQDSLTKEYTGKWIEQIRQILDRKSSPHQLLALRRKVLRGPHSPDLLSPQKRVKYEQRVKDIFKNEEDISKKESSLLCLSPERIYEQKQITEVPKMDVRSHFDIEEVTKDEGHLLDPELSLDEYGEFKSITPIITRFSKEAFKYVFPKTETDINDLKDYASSSELLKEIQQKVMLLKTRQQEESASGEKKQRKKKFLSVRVTVEEDIKKEEIQVSSDTSVVKSKIKRGRIIKDKDSKKDKGYESSDTSSRTSTAQRISKRPKIHPESPSPKRIERAEKTKRKPDKEITSGRLEKNVTELSKKDRQPFKKERETEMKYAEIKPEKIKKVEESGDGLIMAVKKASKELSKKKEEKPAPQRKPQKEDKVAVSESYTKAIKDAKDKLTAPKESKVPKEPKAPKESEKEKRSKSAYAENVNVNQVKIRKGSLDDNDLGLLKFKDSTQQEKAKKLTQSELYILPPPVQRQPPPKVEKTPSDSQEDSDLDTDIEELLKKSKLIKVNEIIIGQKILKQRLHDKRDKRKEIRPLLFESTFYVVDTEVKKEVMDKKTSIDICTEGKRKRKDSDQEAAKGTVRYALSNRSFIDKEWTMLPTEKIVRKLNVYRMRPSHPEFDWFENNKSKQVMYYDTGEILAEFHEDGRGRWYYRNGRLALDYYNAEEMNAGQRYVVYSNGEPDDQGCPRPITVLATFDYLGNGIVFDHTGKTRLKYNQTEGIVLDKSIGPVSHWKWHELNDPPILQKVMLDTQMAVKDPEILKLGGRDTQTLRPDNEEMLAIEFDNFIKEKSKKLTQKFKPFQIKMKALKVNENFSLRVLDQASVYLTFRDGPTNMKLNLGMILDHKEIVDTDTAEVGEVSCNVEKFPARTDSLAMLQRSIAHAQHVERLRQERERRYKISLIKTSIDRLTAAASRPLQPPLCFQPTSGRTIPKTECYCKQEIAPPCT